MSAIYSLRDLLWDTQFFGTKMGEIILMIDEQHPLFSSEVWDHALVKARNEAYQFLLCQFDSRCQEIATILMNTGARLGDVLVTFGRDLSQSFEDLQPEKQYQIDRAEPGDLPEIMAIAQNSFVYSRFFQGPRFDVIKVQRFYPDWIAESFDKEEIYVLKQLQKVEGFVSLQYQPQTKIMIVRLIAIKEGNRGFGMGQALIDWVLQYSRKQDCQEVQVGTQVSNYAAICLYEKNGFRLKNAKYRFHIWLDVVNESKVAVVKEE